MRVADLAELIHPDDRAGNMALLRRPVSGEIPGYEVENRFLHRSGSPRWVHKRVTALRDAAGRVTHLMALVTDVTERRRAEEELRASESRFRLLVDGVRDHALFMLDPDGKVATWNAGAERLKGYAAHEAVGRHYALFFLAEDVALGLPERLLAQARTSGRAEYEGWRVRKDGTRFWANAVLHAGHDAGRLAGFAKVTRDLSERRHLENRYRQAQKDGGGGAARGRDRPRLQQPPHRDQRVQRGGPVRAPRGRPVARVHRAGPGGRGRAALTRQLLAFSRKQVLQPTSLDLNALLADTDRLLGRVIGADVALTMRAAPGLWRVRADAGQVEQVVMNLVVNARDAVPAGGRLTVETANVTLDAGYVAAHPEARVGEFVRLAVSDTGCGMGAATKGRIFEPFFTTKGDKGTGLGLATVFGIVEQSGGHVEVYSEPGVGTTFKVYLPRGNETVLLAEDEDGVRGLAKLVLQRAGYTVLEARHGAEAVQICERHAGVIHLLATDVIMPNMGGPRVAERLRELRPGVKVLYLSGYTDDTVVRHGLLEANVAFLQKPFSVDALVQKVREVLDRPG